MWQSKQSWKMTSIKEDQILTRRGGHMKVLTLHAAWTTKIVQRLAPHMVPKPWECHPEHAKTHNPPPTKIDWWKQSLTIVKNRYLNIPREFWWNWISDALVKTKINPNLKTANFWSRNALFIIQSCWLNIHMVYIYICKMCHIHF